MMAEKRTIADARHRALASGEGDGLRHTYLVEAGAGTGKTTVLVDRLLALIRSGVDIARIVAITFTEKAAGELKVRLREKLEAAARSASGDEADVLTTALHRIDRAQVSTIHGFCSSLLKERPVEAGVDPGFAVADEFTRTVITETVWDSWLRQEFSSSLPACVAEAEELGHGLDRIRELAFRLAANRDLLDLVPPAVEEGDIDALISDLAATAGEFEGLAATECSDPDDRALPEIARFAREASMIEHVPKDSRTAYVLRQVSPLPTKSGRKGNWSEGVLDDIKSRANDLRDRQAELLGGRSHNATVELVGWLRGFLDAYEKEKARRGVLDFEDLLLRARDLLRDNRGVRDDFKRAFDHVLLDEFQDTDPLQCEIAFFLCEVEGGAAGMWSDVELKPGKLFLVGDPKQSIYRFRRADIETYEAARSIVARAGGVLELVENFRTRPEIVEQVNAVFSRVMHAPEDGRSYQPDYAALTAFRETEKVGPGVVILPPASTLEELNAQEVRDIEARTAAAFLKEVRETGAVNVFDRSREEWRPVELRDVAVLFHSTRALDAYEEAFGDFGLDYRIAGGKKFYARREVKELATVLAAIEDPHCLAAVVGALRSPFLGASDEEILLHKYHAGTLSYLSEETSGVAAVEEAMALLKELHHERNALPTADLIRRLFDRTNILELFLLKPSGEQRHANLVKIVEIADGLSKDGGLSYGGFVRWLSDVQQLAPEESESPLSEEGDDFVRMLTIHKAKGLEFPVVVLADLARLTRHHDRMIVDRAEGRLELGLGGSDNRLATLGYEEMRELEGRRRDAELIRLLYVGTTRARDTLIVPWFTGGRRQRGDGLLEYLEAIGPSVHGTALDVASARSKANPVAVDAATLETDIERRRPTRLRIEEAAALDWRATEAAAELSEWRQWLSSLGESLHEPVRVATPSSHGGAFASDGVAAQRETTSASAGSPGGALDGVSGAEMGTLVHTVLESLDLGSAGEAHGRAAAVARSTGLPESSARAAAAMIERSAGSEILRRAANATKVWRELPFCVSCDGGFMEGKVDLVFEDERRLVIVDYKTDEVTEVGLEAASQRYKRQATAYAVALSSVSGLPVAEVVLLFMRGPHEVRIVSDVSPEDARRLLSGTLWEVAPT
jgi:ATP-dependent helicase/nuclease subunit A